MREHANNSRLTRTYLHTHSANQIFLAGKTYLEKIRLLALKITYQNNGDRFLA